MADTPAIRLLVAADLAAYKQLRDVTLAAEPEAFTSDAAEESLKNAQSYLSRLGLDRQGPDGGGHVTLGAFTGAGQLVGAVSCDREVRIKGRHIAHVLGMMVVEQARGQGIGRRLLAECITRARQAPGLEMLTLSVTASNHIAVDLYLRAGFTRYGTLARAIKIGDRYHDKDLMVLTL
jgi:ribosomal protein S18 acetylase RimI-like enzyme